MSDSLNGGNEYLMMGVGRTKSQNVRWLNWIMCDLEP